MIHRYIEEILSFQTLQRRVVSAGVLERSYIAKLEVANSDILQYPLFKHTVRPNNQHVLNI
jgi:hypothetical protein